jgi:hypothetical protein
MGVSAVLRPATITVDPGRSARCLIYLRNTGQIVDQFVLSVVGDMSGWARLRPDVVNILPNEESVVELLIAPPMSPEVPAGDHPFAIRIASKEDAAGSVVYEGLAIVTRFVRLNVEIVPHTTRGRWFGRHTVAVDNLGNFPLRVTPAPTDPDLLLKFHVRPRSPVAEPGTATMLRVWPRPVRTFWRGPDRKVPFKVDIVPEVGKAIGVDAALVQRPLLPRRFFMLISLLVMLLFVLLLVVTTILQKQPQSMAGPSPIVPSTSATTPATTTDTGGAPATGSGAQSAPAQGGGGGTGTGGGQPGDFTIAATAFPGSTGTPQLFSYTVPAGQGFRLRSVRFTEPAQDAGTVQVRLEGTVLVSFDLVQLPGLNYTFAAAPTATAGQQVTLAVSCANASAPCSIVGDFAVSPIA